MDIRRDVVEKLVATNKWYKRTAELGERANYRCEYCGLDLLGSVESYKLWGIDHIIPISAGGDPDDINNLAVACRHCNCDFKRTYDPREVTGPIATREQLINAGRNYIFQQKEKTLKEVKKVQEIIGYITNRDIIGD